jgi:hypothetical protein
MEFLSTPIITGKYLPLDFGVWTPTWGALIAFIFVLAIVRSIRAALDTRGTIGIPQRTLCAFPYSFFVSAIATMLSFIWGVFFLVVASMIIGVLLSGIFGTGPKPIARIVVTWIGFVSSLALASWAVLNIRPSASDLPDSRNDVR